MSGKRFRLRSPDPLTEQEKFSKLKTKLGGLVATHEKNALSFSKYLIESKVLASENLDPTELKDLMEVNQNIKLDIAEQSEKSANRDLKEIESLTDLKVISCGSKIEKVVDGKDVCIKSWQTEILPDKINFPKVILIVQFKAKEEPSTGKMPDISKLIVDIEGIDVDSDLDEAIKYCEDNHETQLLTRLVKDYLPLYSNRQEIFNNSSKYCKRTADSLEFTNSVGHVLANVCLLIKMNKRSLSWNCSWMCKLTDAGSVACQSVHVPSELSKSGTVAAWSWDKAVENLAKVARFDSETPVKGNNESWDISQLSDDTPKGEENSKRIPKRKLI